MSKKYFKRFFVWALLVISLSVITYYNRVLFVQPLKDEIVDLHQAELNTQRSISQTKADIERYNNMVYDELQYLDKVPYYNEEEVIKNYIHRPILVSDAKLIQMVITDSEKAKDLKLSSEVGSKKITLNIEVDDIKQFNELINEVNRSLRIIYFGDFDYTLPGEKGLYSEEPQSIKIKFELHIFYTRETTIKQ